MPKLTDGAGFDIDNFGIFSAVLFQQLSNRLGRLTRFHQLPGNEAHLFFCRKRLGTNQTAVFFLADKICLAQSFPMLGHLRPASRRKRIACAFFSVFFGMDKNQIVQTVVFDF